MALKFVVRSGLFLGAVGLLTFALATAFVVLGLDAVPPLELRQALSIADLEAQPAGALVLVEGRVRGPAVVDAFAVMQRRYSWSETNSVADQARVTWFSRVESVQPARVTVDVGASGVEVLMTTDTLFTGSKRVEKERLGRSSSWTYEGFAPADLVTIEGTTARENQTVMLHARQVFGGSATRLQLTDALVQRLPHLLCGALMLLGVVVTLRGAAKTVRGLWG